MKSADTNLNGFLLVDKPAGITSHDAVQKVRKVAGQRRIGHTGTLDPLATGLMIMCLGSATKAARFVSDMDKTYEAEICLGRTSTTYDSEGVNTEETAAEIPKLSVGEIRSILAEFAGRQLQEVPSYSAVSVDGRRLYDLARKGEEIELPSREIEIKSIELNGYTEPHINLTVTCSKGTYVRTLAHDIGQRIGCGAYLSNLRRTAIGHLSVADALTVEDIATHAQDGRLDQHLLKYDEIFDYGAYKVTDDFGEKVVSGPELRAENIAAIEGEFQRGDRVFIRNGGGRVLAIGTAELSAVDAARVKNDSKLFSYLRVLN